MSSDFAPVLKVLSLALAAVGLGGCATSTELGGIWRGTAPAESPLLQASLGQAPPVGVELVLGQYGSEVAGLIRFWRSGEFLLRRNADLPDEECGCAYLRDGRVDTRTSKATFRLEGCLPALTKGQTVRVRGQVALQDGQLEATLTVDQPGSPLHGQQTELRLDRHAAPGDTEPADLRCVPPPAGNTASGL